MAKKFTMYLISHSHTDIGYTDRQEKIERYHVDFIKQVINMNKEIEAGSHPNWEGFRWTCENYWQVENFLKSATSDEKTEFYRLIQEKKIDVSLNYLNLTELVDDQILRKKLQEGKEWAREIDFKGNSAMTADINGYSWGYASALYDNGIKNLFSCIHGHHGLSPLRRQQRPFKWKTPDGKELFVWNGGHYMLGNEFLLIPNTRFTYHLKDEFMDDHQTNQFEITEKRIFKYVHSLKADHYMFDYVPVMISGVLTDNAPANGELMDTINLWNEKHGQEIFLQMITLNDFFEIAEKETGLPVYSGDWNDWWADGVGSTPAATKIYKEAQRKYQLAEKLDPDGLTGITNEKHKAEDNLIMYAEHTWGYSSSISEPWNTLVNELEYRKTGYATQASVAASLYLDEILAKHGEVSIRPNREKRFKIINPHDQKIVDMATVYIEHWENVEDIYIDEKNIHRLSAVDQETGKELLTQAMKTARATEVKIWIELEPKEEKNIKVIFKPEKQKLYDLSLIEGSEGVQDILEKQQKNRANINGVENDYFSTVFEYPMGISHLELKKNACSIINDEMLYAPFSGVYEVTPIRQDPVEERRLMGRNRKGKFAKRSQAVLKDIRILDDGEIFTSVLFDYELEGTRLYAVYMKFFKTTARIDATIRLHKESVWAPENLYVSLPFSLPNSKTWIDKTGCLIRPGIDQLPDTNMEFYLTQNGWISESEKGTLFVNCKDAPLLTYGDLDFHEIQLANESTTWKNTQVTYSWIMNNFWETNFKADLGGFYEFDYSLNFYDKIFDQKEARDKLEEFSQGIIGISV